MMETPEEFPVVPNEVIDIPDFPEAAPGEPEVIEFPDEIEEAELDEQDLDNARVEGDGSTES